MNISLKKMVVSTLVILTAFNSSFAQDARTWWNSLTPAWKKIFYVQELKGQEDKEPNDEQLANIINITRLKCNGNKEITDLKPLSMLTLLEQLDCSNTNITSLSGIEPLRNLRKLDCSNNDNINSLMPLQTLYNLEELNCGNTMVKNLAPLRNLRSLKKLDVHFCTVNNLSMISELKILTDLNVSQNQSLFVLDGIDRLPNLINFDCSQTSVDNLAPLANLKQLEILNCSQTNIITLRPLQNLRTLKEIDCSNTNIQAASLDYLYSHSRLTMLRGRNISVSQKQIDEFTNTFSKRNPACDVVLTPSKQ